MMKAKLFCKTGKLSGETFLIEKKATIGKHPDNTIVLSPAVISGKHACIYFDEESQCYYLEDLDSSNGTKLDGAEVSRPEKLRHLHVITFAKSFDFIFHHSASKNNHRKAPITPARPTVVSTKKIANPLSTEPGKKTIVAGMPRNDSAAAPDSGKSLNTPIMKTKVHLPKIAKQTSPNSEPASGQQQAAKSMAFFLEAKIAKRQLVRFPLSEGENLIGRAAECDIRIEDESLSRKHAVIKVAGDKISIADLQSKNHTSVNKIKIDVEVAVLPGAKIRFGIVEACIKSAP